MTSLQHNELVNACRVLFPGAEITKDFLNYIQPEGLKNAYRSRAWEYHPDAVENAADQARNTELFRRTVDAYKLLNNYLGLRKSTAPSLSLKYSSRAKATSFRQGTVITRRNPNETYYDDSFPTFELKIGLYLYYRGVISYQALVRAMVWQREMRPPIGDYACKWGWMTERDVALVLRATDIVGSFGERAVELGFLNRSQLNILLMQQRSIQQPIGRYFVDNALLTEYSLKQHLRELTEHNKRVREQRESELPAAEIFLSP